MNFESLYYEVISKDRKLYQLPMLLMLRSVAVFYVWVQSLRAGLYRSGLFKTRRLPARVISVGNLTLGGTGKTPTVMLIAETLQAQGFKPAILSRGYGGETVNEVNVVCDGKAVLLDPEIAGDEPVMMAHRLKNVPILTGRNRFKTGRYALEHLGADTLILDDGFQHLALHRDLNILLCDHKSPFGNEVIFPAGHLREPLQAVRRADLICVTRYGPAGNLEAVQRVNSKQVPLVKMTFEAETLVQVSTGESTGLDAMKDRPVAALCGIAQPKAFLKSLEQAQARVVSHHIFPDHFQYLPEHLRAVEEKARAAGAEWLVTTEKDAVKLLKFEFSIPVYRVCLAVNIVDGREAWNRMLEAAATVPAG